MFELYDIFDNNEINVILLIIVVIILIIVIVGLGIYDYTMKRKLIKVETKLKSISDKLDININNNNLLSDIPKNNNNNNNYKEKYEDLLKEKDAKQSQSMQYSPSEYSTLLKYNPILPYSAFTMDIINNAYLDMNEQGMYEDKYFALSNYDNIYDRTKVVNSNNSNNSNSNVDLADQQAVDMGKLAEMQDADNPSLNSVVSDIGPETTYQDSKF